MKSVGIFRSLFIALFALSHLHAADGTWLGNSGNWGASGTWSGGTIANAAGFTAVSCAIDLMANIE